MARSFKIVRAWKDEYFLFYFPLHCQFSCISEIFLISIEWIWRKIHIFYFTHNFSIFLDRWFQLNDEYFLSHSQFSWISEIFLDSNWIIFYPPKSDLRVTKLFSLEPKLNQLNEFCPSLKSRSSSSCNWMMNIFYFTLSSLLKAMDWIWRWIFFISCILYSLFRSPRCYISLSSVLIKSVCCLVNFRSLFRNYVS